MTLLLQAVVLFHPMPWGTIHLMEHQWSKLIWNSIIHWESKTHNQWSGKPQCHNIEYWCLNSTLDDVHQYVTTASPILQSSLQELGSSTSSNVTNCSHGWLPHHNEQQNIPSAACTNDFTNVSNKFDSEVAELDWKLQFTKHEMIIFINSTDDQIITNWKWPLPSYQALRDQITTGGHTHHWEQVTIAV